MKKYTFLDLALFSFLAFNISSSPVSADEEKNQNLQDNFLNALRKEHAPVSMFLVSGIELQGTVDNFDESVIILKNTNYHMVYKHAISTIVPGKSVESIACSDERDDEGNICFSITEQ